MAIKNDVIVQHDADNEEESHVLNHLALSHVNYHKSSEEVEAEVQRAVRLLQSEAPEAVVAVDVAIGALKEAFI